MTQIPKERKQTLVADLCFNHAHQPNRQEYSWGVLIISSEVPFLIIKQK